MTSIARALGGGHVGGDARADDRRALLGIGVETEIAGAARQGGHRLDPVDDAADQSDVAVEMPRRLADHRIEFGAAARIGRHVAPDADHRVAMRQPRRAPVARHRPAVAMPDLRGIGVARRHWPEGKPRQRPLIFGGRMRDDPRGQRRRLLVGARPLHDIIVLHALDRAAIEPAGADERANVGDMDGCEAGRELDRDMRPAGQIHQQQVLGRDRPPRIGGRRGDDLAGRERRRGRRCRAEQERDQGERQGRFAHAGKLAQPARLRKSGDVASRPTQRSGGRVVEGARLESV